MKIDKNRFLLLTTTLAATTVTAIVVTLSACNTVQTDTDAGENTLGDGGLGPTSDATEQPGDGGSSCLGNTGPAPTCSLPTTEGGDELDAGDAGDAGQAAVCPTECEAFNKNFKTEVATALAGCVDLKGPDVEACSAAVPDCVTATLAKACDDTEAAAYCTQLLGTCYGDAGAEDAGADDAGSSAITQAQCTTLVKALSTEGKTTLTSCVNEGSCEDCIGRIKQGF